MTANVVVTGMGTINPLGHTMAETWQNALAGVSGIGPISLFDASGWPVQIAGEVKHFSPESVLGSKDARRRDRCEQFAAVAAREAISQANLMDSPVDSQRVGVIVSSAIGGINSLQDTILMAFSENPRRVSPFAIPMLMSNGAAGMIAIDYGFLGPCFSDRLRVRFGNRCYWYGLDDDPQRHPGCGRHGRYRSNHHPHGGGCF